VRNIAHMSPRGAAVVALFAAMLGLVFAGYSTYDYAEQLDRQVHAVHCSFVPGAPVSADAENPCKAALFSPYSALLRTTYWGGIPISLFGFGAFAFFAGFTVYLAAAGDRSTRNAHSTFVLLAIGPVIASAVMFAISIVHLHALCKLCVGIYVSSVVLFVAAFLGKQAHGRALRVARSYGEAPVQEPRHGWLLTLACALALGVSALAPAVAYAGALPNYRPLLDKCGKLAAMSEAHHGLLKIPTSHPLRPVILFEDPLCPTCKAFHERLVDEGIFDKLDITMAMFPLDSECNWMLDRALHPGACVMAKAVLCAGNDKARAVLEWAYADQEELREAGKKGASTLLSQISHRWGPDLATCASGNGETQRLNQHLHFAANNHIPVSTPQMFLGDQRLCDEDTDLGLDYTLARLAPELLP
jgi:uncharacterized membrane protein